MTPPIASEAVLATMAGNPREERVDCAGCTACCRRELVILAPGDDPADFPEAIEVPVNPFADGPGFVIPHKADGSCMHLGANGCTIYDRRPVMCRAFSCVGFVASVLARTTRQERRRDLASGELGGDVWEAGMRRIKARRAAA